MRAAGTADLPLHGGKAPRWLFRRMQALGRSILEVMLEEYRSATVVERLSDPFWFQALACVLGFDWHSSGTTTVTCGVLKEALGDGELGLAVAGGKGALSLKAPAEIEIHARRYGLSETRIAALTRASRLTARVDTAALQDGHQLYHHALLMTREGRWGVIQQGLNDATSYARRYHWFDRKAGNCLTEPHRGLLGFRQPTALDLTHRHSDDTRSTTLDLVRDDPMRLRRDLRSLPTAVPSGQTRLSGGMPLHLAMPRRINWPALRQVYEFQPRGYDDLLLTRGVGPATVRALSLVAELVYGAPPSWRDPVKFSFTVGGKDGVPFPVDRRAMDRTTQVLRQGVRQARLGRRQELAALRRLRRFVPPDR